MGLFGKPKITYVFVFFRNNPPTEEEEKQILLDQAKGRKIMAANRAWMSDEPAVAFGESHEMTDEDWFQPAAVRDAHLAALCALWMAKNSIGTSGKGEEFKVKQVKNFIVATKSQDFVPVK